MPGINQKKSAGSSQGTAANLPSREEQMRAVTVGPLIPLTCLIELAEYDPMWPQLFAQEKERIRAALGDRILMIEHVGSTSTALLSALIANLPLCSVPRD